MIRPASLTSCALVLALAACSAPEMPPPSPEEKAGQNHLRCTFSLTAYQMGLAHDLETTPHASDKARITGDIAKTAAAFNYHLDASHRFVPDPQRWHQFHNLIKTGLGQEKPDTDPAAIASVPHILECLETAQQARTFLPR